MQGNKINITPFRMKVTEQVHGIDVISILSLNDIGLARSFSYPFELILYKGDGIVLTMTDEWIFDKYESIPLIEYNDFIEKYT